MRRGPSPSPRRPPAPSSAPSASPWQDTAWTDRPSGTEAPSQGPACPGPRGLGSRGQCPCSKPAHSPPGDPQGVCIGALIGGNGTAPTTGKVQRVTLSYPHSPLSTGPTSALELRPPDDPEGPRGHRHPAPMGHTPRGLGRGGLGSNEGRWSPGWALSVVTQQHHYPDRLRAGGEDRAVGGLGRTSPNPGSPDADEGHYRGRCRTFPVRLSSVDQQDVPRSSTDVWPVVTLQ